MVCIIDDREDVWSHALNLIHVKPYHFFQHTGDINAPPGLDKHENDEKEGVDLTKITAKSKPNKLNGKKVDIGNGTNDNNEIIEENNEKPVNNVAEKKEVQENEEVKDCKEGESDKNNEDCDKSEKPELLENNTKTEDPSVNSEMNHSKEEVLPVKEDELLEIEDGDDYLLYLEDILKRIHTTFYEEYDKMESGEVPDLKKVIPSVRREVLKGTNLVFSGLVPTHIKLEQSKAYQVARSLGATVTQDLEEDTTHLVAVRPGTAKVNAGRRKKNLKIVTPDWLWACAECWEHVEEKMFPLNSKGSKNRHPPPHCSSPEHINYPVHNTPAVIRKRTPSGRFMDTINPLMSFSSDDIADMDKEVIIFKKTFSP